jgi:hypothetical protein
MQRAPDLADSEALSVSYVAGRSHDLALMKPDRYLVELSLAALSAQPGEAVLTGDSATDNYRWSSGRCGGDRLHEPPE